MSLPERFRGHLLGEGVLEEGDRVVVACSGGLDSTVLLHLLRFAPGLPRLVITVAHFDHRMRPESARDAAWVRGLAGAWDLAVESRAAEAPPRNELEARRSRYAFLHEARARLGARWLLTAHQADDQAETVLFRVFRGAGLRGLQGIPPRGAGGLLRPLLPFQRSELQAYAERHKVPWLTDPSNRDVRYARNVIRHEILPRAEAAVARGARRSLVRLARLARREEEAWRTLLPGLLEAVTLEADQDGIVIVRPRLLSYHPAVRARLLREAVHRLGATLDEAGTRAVLEFTSSSASGRRHSLPGGLILAREFDHLLLRRSRREAEEAHLDIPSPEAGQGTLSLGGRTYRAEWTRSGAPAGAWVESFATDRMSFPLRMRAWSPGDRIRMAYGSKKLKKLFLEARLPLEERSRRPVLVDARGILLWVPGLARSVEAPDAEPKGRLTIGVRETDTA